MTNPTEAAGFIRPGDWVADLPACTITFAVRNFGLRTVTGQIPLTSASVTVGPSGRPVGIRAELDAHGIDTGNRRRDSDLRGTRFLDTGPWPTITFEANGIQANEAGWTVDGTLTVRDTRCAVQLDVSDPRIPPGDPAAPVILHGTAHIDRRSAGVNAAPAFLVGHIITLSLTVRLCPPATDPGVSLMRAHHTAAPAKEGRR
jgi:polyisoprenoid-binding protein YceI